MAEESRKGPLTQVVVWCLLKNGKLNHTLLSSKGNVLLCDAVTTRGGRTSAVVIPVILLALRRVVTGVVNQ